MSHTYMYVPGQVQCPKCGGGVGDAGHLVAVGSMPAKPMDHVSMTCAVCGVISGISMVAQSNARAQDIAAWGHLPT